MYLLLFKTLEKVEADTKLHVHKENNILFKEAMNF